MKTTAFVFLALVSGAVLAASAVDADALFHGGEKYWYGQGVTADMAKGDALFRQAAAAGSQDARQALQLTARRQAAMPRIDYYLHGYDGADVKLDCAKVSIPAVSGPDDYKDVGGKIDAWEACYNRFVLNLNRRLPAGKVLPAELTYLMTDAEIKQAVEHLDRVYAAAGAEGQRVLASFEIAKVAWQEQTNDNMVNINTMGKLLSDRMRDAADHRQFMASNGPPLSPAWMASMTSATGHSNSGTGTVKH